MSDSSGARNAPPIPQDTESAATLLPCPFCNGKANVDGFVGSWYIRCTTDDCWCNDHSMLWVDVDKAIAAWNRRVAPATLAAAQAMLRALTAVEALDDCEAHIEDGFERALPAIREAIALARAAGIQEK